MKLPSFIRLPEYSRFEYKPIYFNERKDKLAAKIKEHQKTQDVEETRNFKPEFKARFKSSYTREITRRQKKAANLRLAVIIAFFGLISFMILQKADIISYMFNVLFSE